MLASYAGISTYFAGKREQSGIEQPEPKETKRQLAVAALGRIEPRSEIIKIGAGFSADRLESLFVARGDIVTKSQVLGYLGGYAEQIAQRNMYRAQLEEAKLRFKTELELNRRAFNPSRFTRKRFSKSRRNGSLLRRRRSRVSRRATHKPVVDRRRWTIFGWAIAPAAAASQYMHDSADDVMLIIYNPSRLPVSQNQAQVSDSPSWTPRWKAATC